MARLQLDANTATGFAQLEVASTGNCTLNVPGQEIWLQNRLSGAAPLIVEIPRATSRTTSSNVRLIADADLEELQAIFDAAALKRYDRVDVDQRGRPERRSC